jgi:[ribosomal protein S5]-alanine N-acetyltransferase
MILDRTIPRLVTARTMLTIPEPSEAQRVLDYFERNRERLEPVSPPWAEGFFTREYWRRRLVVAREEFFADQSLRLYVSLKDDDAIVGAVSFTPFFRLALQRCILGYSVDAAHEGKGVLREALEVAIEYVFDELEFHRIEANYIPTNERSGNLLRRLGFSVEGYARDYLFLGGRWRDHVLTAKTNAKMSSPPG